MMAQSLWPGWKLDELVTDEKTAKAVVETGGTECGQVECEAEGRMFVVSSRPVTDGKGKVIEDGQGSRRPWLRCSAM